MTIEAMSTLASMGRFRTVVVDPPWDSAIIGYTATGRLGRRVPWYNPKMPYDTMSVSDIASLPIPSILADDAVVFCWTTSRFLSEAFGIIDAWGLQYAFTMAWVKQKGPQFPKMPCFNTEFCVVGRKNKVIWTDTKQFRTGNFWPSVRHSEKPEGFYDLLRRVTPEPRLDVFGRRSIPGFHSWGHEAPSGPPPPNHYQTVLQE